MTTSATAAEHGCPRCDKRWGGKNTAHCGFGCHETFVGVTAFDKHQKSGKCMDPLQVGLELSKRSYPAWSTGESYGGADGPLEGAE